MPQNLWKAVVVDDEELARAFLAEMLRRHADVTVAAECANGFEAVKAIAETSPDLLGARTALAALK